MIAADIPCHWIPVLILQPHALNVKPTLYQNKENTMLYMSYHGK